MATPAQQAPWSVKGIAPQTREAVKEAARRSGMTIGEWLNAAITQQASSPLHQLNEGPSAHDLRWTEIASHLTRYVRQNTPQAEQQTLSTQTVSLHAIEQLLKENQARQEQQSREQAIHIAKALTSLARYIERTESNRHEEAQNTSSQREQVNSDLIQTLNLVGHRIKSMEEKIAHLPREIIAPVTEAASSQLAMLSERIIPAMEERLAIQMRDIMVNLSSNQSRPASIAHVDSEQLEIEERLARAIADIRSRQLELARLETTESEDISQRAILERLEGLSRQLDMALASSLDNATSSSLKDVLQRLDRIDSRLDNVQAPLDIGLLENMVHELSENIEVLHLSRDNSSPVSGEGTLDTLAEQISQLAQHLDNASRQSIQSLPESTGILAEREHLTALETAISALSLQLRDLPKIDTDSLERLAKVAAREALTAMSANEHNSTRQRSARTDDALEAVHNTLERVADRLSQLEAEMNTRANAGGVTRIPATGAPERRAAQALSQASNNHLPSPLLLQDGPEDLLARETVGLNEHIGLTANFIAAARRAAMAAADETRLSSAEIQSRHSQNDSADAAQRTTEATSERRRSLLMGLGALIAATGAVQIASIFMQEVPRLS